MFCEVRAGSGKKEQVFNNVSVIAWLHLKKTRAIVP
jgi:hypothetical protein